MYRVWSLYRGLTRVLPSPFIPGPFREGVLGQMAPVGFGCASRRRAVSRVLTYPGRRDVASESEVGLRAGLLIGEAIQRRLESKASAPVGEVGRSSRRAGAVPLRPDLLIGDWTTLSV